MAGGVKVQGEPAGEVFDNDDDEDMMVTMVMVTMVTVMMAMVTMVMIRVMV